MNSLSLKTYWEDAGEALYKYTSAAIDKTSIQNETYIFITTCGLPLEAAPFLSFDLIRANRLLSPNKIFRINFEELDNYLMFGSNGSGDPVCIDTINNDEIVYLNHDNYFERIFINTGIWQFAECLIRYRRFLISLADASNAWAKRKFANDEFEGLKTDFINIDKHCLAENAFWQAELNALLWERDNK